MRVLVACEFSGIVRDQFRQLGHDAWSCDILPTEADPRWHLTGDVSMFLGEGWDLMVAHPPCTFLAVTGQQWNKKRPERLPMVEAALHFVLDLMEAPIPHIAIENPVSIISGRIRKPDQYIQPWQFGHGETKKTGLWLKNLPLLQPTNIVDGREPRVWKMSPGPNRWRERSRTFKGIAMAMADQWGSYINERAMAEAA
jgi:hypothetical protein